MELFDFLTTNREYGIGAFAIAVIVWSVVRVSIYAIDKVAFLLEEWRKTLDRVTDVTEKLAAASEKNLERQDIQIKNLETQGRSVEALAETITNRTDDLAAYSLKVANEVRSVGQEIKTIGEHVNDHTSKIDESFDEFRRRHDKLLPIVTDIKKTVETLPELINTRFDQSETLGRDLKDITEEIKTQLASAILKIYAFEKSLQTSDDASGPDTLPPPPLSGDALSA